MIASENVTGRAARFIATATSAAISSRVVDRSGGDAHERELQHDDRAVDQQAEVDRAERHQVPRDPQPHHADDRDGHRERDRERGDERAAEAAQRQEQDDHDQQRALRRG